ncbi:hypothetical protein EB796_013187 [Bugula neritina]|uniref:kynurenine--oxoglutarate transaminase n=1 Tax=Bugula neritina TaxID=10212 RepID=A0A7J7JS73_BUGNE|nr:hypothetical protein EB796_013187 [Bugula neritina]
MVRMSEGRAVFVPLRPSVTPPTRSEHWKLDPVELEGKFSDKTKLIIFNTPHNPTGKILQLLHFLLHAVETWFTTEKRWR